MATSAEQVAIDANKLDVNICPPIPQEKHDF